MIVRRFAALVAVAMLLAACSTAGAADPTADGGGGELGATTWILQSYSSVGILTLVPDDQYADAEFRSNRVSGFSGCNEYDAVYRTGGRLLLVSQAKVTLRACPDPAAALETTYLALLAQSRFYNVRDDILTIRGADLAVLLVFEAAPANPLLGSWVVDSFATAPGSLAAPLPGTSLTAVFRLAKVGGSSGCNTYQGPYTTNGDVAAIGPLASTRMACAEDVLAQETAFLAALQGVARVERRGAILQLKDRTGGVAVLLIKPSEVPSASPSATAALPSTRPSAVASASASASPSPSPTPKPTPTASPTPTATPAPPTARPTAAPSGSLPPIATCTLTAAGVVASARIAYPAAWFTVAAPPNLACHVFDPAPITVPADPSTLVTAVQLTVDPSLSFAAALASATNLTAWNVLVNEPATAAGLPAQRIEATSTVGSPGFPPGATRYGYLINLGAASAWIQTSGTVGQATFVTNSSVVDLMAAQSTIVRP
jgi:heat shock protein HslJ